MVKEITIYGVFLFHASPVSLHICLPLQLISNILISLNAYSDQLFNSALIMCCLTTLRYYSFVILSCCLHQFFCLKLNEIFSSD